MVYMAGCKSDILPTAYGVVETWFILEDNGTLNGVTLIWNKNYILGFHVGASIIFYNEYHQMVFQSDWRYYGLNGNSKKIAHFEDRIPLDVLKSIRSFEIRSKLENGMGFLKSLSSCFGNKVEDENLKDNLI
uniref:Uncharacterized protein n=1 Tax=Acrobeloides nanus TaxID=290746 RepID=A0A914EDE3_9BILA